MKISNPCPHLSQWDNKLYPSGSCNLTCLAMAMKKYGLKGPAMGYDRLADNLLAYADKHGIDRHTVEGIDKISEAFGLKDKSSYSTSFDELKKHIKAGKVAIVHGNFTGSGHIVLVRGLDEEVGKWQCNDPAGVWDHGYHDYRSGEGVWYDGAWFRKMIAPDGVIWAHLLA